MSYLDLKKTVPFLSRKTPLPSMSSTMSSSSVMSLVFRHCLDSAESAHYVMTIINFKLLVFCYVYYAFKKSVKIKIIKLITTLNKQILRTICT